MKGYPTHSIYDLRLPSGNIDGSVAAQPEPHAQNLVTTKPVEVPSLQLEIDNGQKCPLANVAFQYAPRLGDSRLSATPTRGDFRTPQRSS